MQSHSLKASWQNCTAGKDTTCSCKQTGLLMARKRRRAPIVSIFLVGMESCWMMFAEPPSPQEQPFEIYGCFSRVYVWERAREGKREGGRKTDGAEVTSARVFMLIVSPEGEAQKNTWELDKLEEVIWEGEKPCPNGVSMEIWRASLQSWRFCFDFYSLIGRSFSPSSPETKPNHLHYISLRIKLMSQPSFVPISLPSPSSDKHQTNCAFPHQTRIHSCRTGSNEAKYLIV